MASIEKRLILQHPDGMFWTVDGNGHDEKTSDMLRASDRASYAIESDANPLKDRGAKLVEIRVLATLTGKGGADYFVNGEQIEQPVEADPFSSLETIEKAAAFYEILQGARAAGKDWWTVSQLRQIEQHVAQDAKIRALEKDLARAEDEISDLRNEPWPAWAEAVVKVVRKRSGYDGFDDASEGVDLPAELEECFDELEREAERYRFQPIETLPAQGLVIVGSFNARGQWCSEVASVVYVREHLAKIAAGAFKDSPHLAWEYTHWALQPAEPAKP